MPIGAKAISASLMCWMPKGMPMIVMKQATAELRWPIASHQPASRNQITLPTSPRDLVPKSTLQVSSSQLKPAHRLVVEWSEAEVNYLKRNALGRVLKTQDIRQVIG